MRPLYRKETRVVTKHSGDRIDDLLRALPPAPAGWTQRAEELPRLERALELFEERCPGADLAEHRGEVDATLLEVGLEPDDQRMHVLERLRELRGAR
jgi:hypothetical protein